LVVLMDAVFIKLVAWVPMFQRGDYLGVRWRRGHVALLVGNAASFFIGVIGSHAPWIAQESGVLE
jgi:hypothetical protein